MSEDIFDMRRSWLKKIVLITTLGASCALIGAPDGAPFVRFSPTTRHAEVLLNQLGRKCAGCGTTEGPFDLDHKIALRSGGKNEIENIQVLCRTCHHKKNREERIILHGKKQSQQDPRSVSNSKLIEKLRETWKEANEKWEDLSYRWDIASIGFEGSRRRIYLKDGRELLPFDDGSTKVIGISNPDLIAEMVKEGLLAHDAEVWIIPRRAPVIEKIVSTRKQLEEASKVTDKEARIFG